MIRQPYKNLSLEQLGNFCDVIRHGGYAEAARQSGLSAATLWEQVHALERYYGVELFKRQGRTVTPTIEAQRLAEMVRPLLAGIESTKDVLLQEGGALPEKVTLVAGTRMLMDEVGRALARFHERFPTIRLEIEHAGSEQLQSLVSSGHADLAMTVEPLPHIDRSPDVEYKAAYDVEYLLVTPPKHELVRKKVLRLADILEYPLILRRPSAAARRRVEEVFHRHKLSQKMKIIVETSSGALSVACVREGLGVSIIAGSRQGMSFRGLGVRSVRKWFGDARIIFLRKRGAYRAPALQQLTELIQAIAEGRQAKS